MFHSLRFALALACFPLAALGQQIVFHPGSDTVMGGVLARRSELWAAGNPARPLLPFEALPALFGDRNGDGQLNDAPTRFDACAVVNSALYVSLASNCTLADGTTLLDGDVFRLDAFAALTVVWSESQFAAATGTSTVDVDALAVSASGVVYFSFEDDELTTLPAVIAQNGGNALVDEQCVWRWDPSQSYATLHLTQANVVAVMNAAFGTNATSVVDTCGLEIDPLDPNELWITTASTSATLKGRVASTRGGGVPVQWAGVNFEPASMGFASNFSLYTLAVCGLDWPTLRLTPDTGSSASGGTGTASVTGLSPGAQVQLVVTAPVLPGPFAIPSALPGWAGVCVDPTDPLFAASFAAPELLLVADPTGQAAYAFEFGGMLAGAQALVQAVEVLTLRVSNPVVLSVGS